MTNDLLQWMYTINKVLELFLSCIMWVKKIKFTRGKSHHEIWVIVKS